MSESGIDFEGLKKKKKMALQKGDIGQSGLCIETLSTACTYCGRYWDCPHCVDNIEEVDNEAD